MRSILQRSLPRFLVVGMSSTVIGVLVIYLAMRGLNWGDVTSNLTGYLVGFVWGFWWNRNWTFKHRGSVMNGLLRYGLVVVVAYCANLTVVLLARQYVPGNSFYPQLLGVPIYTLISYLGSRWFAFSPKQVNDKYPG